MRTSEAISESTWEPRTQLGVMVKDGRIKSMDEALAHNLVIRESQIADILLGNLEEDVLEINMVQRMSDSGRRTRFVVTVIVGNGNGYVGLGRAHAREVGTAIRKGVGKAKLNMIHIRRGCGSWQCTCNGEHSVPFRIRGKSGSVELTIMPGPRGLGVVANDMAKRVLTMAGVSDVWTKTSGETRTKVNMAYATFNALRGLVETRGG